MLHTTLRIAKKDCASCPSYDVAISLGAERKYGLDGLIPLTEVFYHLGLGDALWCLRCVLPKERPRARIVDRLAACDFTAHVQYTYESFHPGDTRFRDLIDVARARARGELDSEAASESRAIASRLLVEAPAYPSSVTPALAALVSLLDGDSCYVSYLASIRTADAARLHSGRRPGVVSDELNAQSRIFLNLLNEEE